MIKLNFLLENKHYLGGDIEFIINENGIFTNTPIINENIKNTFINGKKTSESITIVLPKNITKTQNDTLYEVILEVLQNMGKDFRIIIESQDKNKNTTMTTVKNFMLTYFK